MRGALHIRILILLLMAAAYVVLILPAVAQGNNKHVTELEIHGAITPAMALYIDRGISKAEDDGSTAVVIEMDTPGGLSSAMDDIINDILHSEIPVIVYVAPEGARAASAGMYIAYAAHVSAMAPVTNIGSATPVQLSGEGDDSETAMDRKVVNDAVARVRSLAELRGRNADWAEEAVRDAVNIGSAEAVELNVIDFIATDKNDLLQQADGMEVKVESGVVTVDTDGASIDEVGMSLFEQILQVLVNPNVAFVMLSLGTLALVFELSNPGALIPGIAGVLMMVIGFFALGTLESNTAGFVLLAVAFGLFVLEVFVVSHGILTVGGLISFILGGLLLSNTNNPEVLQISRLVIFTTGAMIALFFLFVVGSVAQLYRRPPQSGDALLINQLGVARTDLDPEGAVFTNGEIWRAVSANDELIREGETVRTLDRSGMTLTVERVDEDELVELEVDVEVQRPASSPSD